MTKEMGWQAAGRDRFTPVIAFMDIRPDDRLFEVGCGNGVSVEMISPLLGGGRITAIDRSEKMIERARARNAPNISSGKADIFASALSDFQSDERFGKIFAVNVNLFWIKPQRELDAVRLLLAPDGSLFLFFQPPAGTDLGTLREKLRRNLERSAFEVAREQETRSTAIATLAIQARPAGQ